MKIYPDLLNNPNGDTGIYQEQYEDWYRDQPGKDEETIPEPEKRVNYWKHEYDLELAHAKQAEARITELESDLKLNAKLLSRQCDLARDAETKRDRLSNAIDKHESFKRTHEKVVALEDEELYVTRKGI